MSEKSRARKQLEGMIWAAAYAAEFVHARRADARGGMAWATTAQEDRDSLASIDALKAAAAAVRYIPEDE